ncbi:MAG: LacI family transcriptional regulator [Anaerolineae bacterium]|nr:LacI family transcriptional regulator [Anaerolineae bacterium]MDW8071682.1 LacI family DNA-binding transcriptional regulator [Anaerolineae bacterium]
MATIKDVARAAGVSIATVSHIINGTRPVSDELRARVIRAMEELDYRPNALARSLRIGQTKTIGLIVPDNSNLFFAEIARAIEDTGYRHGYAVILCNSDGRGDKQQRYIQALVDKQVDGIIFISSGETTAGLQYALDNDIRFVMVDREVPDIVADAVLVDNELAGYQATRYLLELGHRYIACVGVPPYLTPIAQRVTGYYKAIEEAGLELPAGFCVYGDTQIESGERAINQLLRLVPRPSAVFVCNDMMAIGVMRGARRMGVSIPEELSVVGFDDIALARAMCPALTTMAQPISEMGRLATELLIKRIKGELSSSERQRIVLTARLVVRESTCPPRST